MDDKAIIWLRRDLRVEDHFAFHCASEMNLKVMPIFIFDENILCSFSNKQDRRLNFIFDRIIHLNKELQKYKVKISVFFGKPIEIFSQLISNLEPNHIIAGAGYEPYDIKRDKEIENLCNTHNIMFHVKNDHLITTPQTILKEDNSPYKVFTPYSRKLFKKIESTYFDEYKIEKFKPWNPAIPISLKKYYIDLNWDKNLCLKKIGYEPTEYPMWDVSFDNKKIQDFSTKIPIYNDTRNCLDQNGTSQFSPYLRFGFISIRACLRAALNTENNFSWVNELIWRDYYAMALFHFPECASQEFTEKYRSLNWQNNKDLYNKFKNAETGYPIIDAAMQQLYKVGWVHNRARMIVASFMTKHLLLDWRLGEKLYSEHLMDYELSSNVGGWQWAASTGFDAQPYFRIFNPYTQSKRFDPEGVYIKQFLPQLKNCPVKHIHNPSDFDEKIDYPNPIVNHEVARKKALEFYKKVN